MKIPSRNPPTPAARVWGLLRFPFSAAVRAHTIGELLKDPATRELTLTALGHTKSRICPHCHGALCAESRG
jgi:hypothetical protein